MLIKGTEKMICLVAFFVFGILGIFSAKYRSLAKEAFICAAYKFRLKPCPANLDNRIKIGIGMKLFRFPKLSKAWYKHFQVFSVIFTLLFFASFGYSIYATTNLIRFKSCDPHSSECIFNPGEITCGSEQCAEKSCLCEKDGCEEPTYLACEGICDCEEKICG